MALFVCMAIPPPKCSLYHERLSSIELGRLCLILVLTSHQKSLRHVRLLPFSEQDVVEFRWVLNRWLRTLSMSLGHHFPNLVMGRVTRRAFEFLKMKLSKEPNLYAPNYDLELAEKTGASDKGIGIILAQTKRSEEHPIIYLSRNTQTLRGVLALQNESVPQ